ncbi:hypothetical protein BB558_003088 [Smittium angustum]|uniref:Ribosomal protein S16 n=1 Tax=Smittium angustum TaxID=133377 RepID=A0A2U1J6X2_SMIAN|nr:hypothetical protein BB558_003088 [Smittium angustum]
MVVRIRLVRYGAKKAPVYHIVASNARTRLTSKPLEKLGTFYPRPNLDDRSKHIQLNFDRTKYWLGVGAQPSDTVSRLLAKAGLVPPKNLNLLNRQLYNSLENDNYTNVDKCNPEQRKFFSNLMRKFGKASGKKSHFAQDYTYRLLPTYNQKQF